MDLQNKTNQTPLLQQAVPVSAKKPLPPQMNYRQQLLTMG